MTKLYYTPPEDKYFNELKEKAIELWYKVDSDNDKFGYASSKVSRIESISNIQDNFMYIVSMFDIDNQKLLANELSFECRQAIRDRMEDGGTPSQYIVF